MPHDQLHKTQFKKNLGVGLLIFGFMAMIWAITMIRIAQNAG